MEEILGLLTFTRSGLILNIVGTLMVAFSFGRNLEDAHQVKNGHKVYLSSFLHPKLFAGGVIIIILGFFLQLIA